MTKRNDWEESAARVEVLCGRIEQLERMFSDFDKEEARWRAWSEERSSKSKAEGRELAVRLSNLERDFHFLIRILQKKTFLIAKACSAALSSKNPLALAYSTRGLFEHVGALALCQSRLSRSCIDLANQGNSRKIDEALERAETFCSRSYYGSTMPSAVYAPYHPSDFISALSDLIKTPHVVYDFLCQYVHPNHGSNRIVSGGRLGKSALVADPKEERKLVQSLTAITETFIGLSESLFYGTVLDLKQLDSWSKYSAKGMKPSKIFAERYSKLGDGSTQENAICFPRARDHSEEMKMLERHLRELGLEKRLAEVVIEDGEFFDRITTQKGILWVRYKHTIFDSF